MNSFTRSSLIAILLIVLPSHAPLHAQKEHPKSPVFKDYKPPETFIGIQQSDATYQLWQGFMVARKANAGDALAQHELGIRYLTGNGFDPDTVKAAYWIRRAAEQNVITARFNLGLLLINGWGVEWDPFEAYQDFLFAAEHNMAQARYVMGQFLTENLVVSRDWEKAFYWVKLAADSGFAPAIEVLPRFAERVHPRAEATGSSTRAAGTSQADTASQRKKPKVPQPTNLIFLDFDAVDTSSGSDEKTLLKEALSSGSLEAQNALGTPSPVGDTLAIDSVRLAYLQRSADVGSPEALAVLGRCYEQGILVKRDRIKAAEYYVRALELESPRAGPLLTALLQENTFAEELKSRAEHANPDAQVAWAGLFTLGLDPFLIGDTRLTGETAFQLLKKAAAKDYVPGLIELGVWYYGGRWIKQDQEKALELWEKAAKLGSREAEVQIAVMRIRESSQPSEIEQALSVLGDASRDGSILATVALAYCNEKGIGIPQRKGEAARLYRHAAQRGSQDAYAALRRMYDEIRPPSVVFQIRE